MIYGIVILAVMWLWTLVEPTKIGEKFGDFCDNVLFNSKID